MTHPMVELISGMDQIILEPKVSRCKVLCRCRYRPNQIDAEAARIYT